ncbi:MAG: nuclear transport factor 2 family protein [Halieaceae bacterium]|nr:nuclear transport factor 2 family protein [Halieaceae bacterium]
MSAERNKATLVDLFENLGPGLDVWEAAYERSLTPDCTWWMQGWPLVVGIEELNAQVGMLNAMMGVYANPILEWRNIDILDDGNTIYFERKGSFADEQGATITDWDIMGVFQFDSNGKICRIRDYFDNAGPYEKLAGLFPPEQISALNAGGRASHPLVENGAADDHFFRNMLEQLEAMA